MAVELLPWAPLKYAVVTPLNLSAPAVSQLYERERERERERWLVIVCERFSEVYVMVCNIS